MGSPSTDPSDESPHQRPSARPEYEDHRRYHYGEQRGFRSSSPLAQLPQHSQPPRPQESTMRMAIHPYSRFNFDSEPSRHLAYMPPLVSTPRPTSSRYPLPPRRAEGERSASVTHPNIEDRSEHHWNASHPRAMAYPYESRPNYNIDDRQTTFERPRHSHGSRPPSTTANSGTQSFSAAAASSSTTGRSSQSSTPICSNCQTTATPLWRRDGKGGLLCKSLAWDILRLCSRLILLFFSLPKVMLVASSSRLKVGPAPSA